MRDTPVVCRGRLDQAFQAITPRPAPVDQAVRRGTVIRARRRLAAGAGLALAGDGQEAGHRRRLAGRRVLHGAHPAPGLGTRYVAFAVPPRLAISTITAYSARGELALAIPFNDPDGGATVGLWLRPGQASLRRATQLIGSGQAGRRAWSVTAYLGPWGECLVTRGGGGTGSACNAVSPPRGTRLLGSTTGPPDLVFGSAGPVWNTWSSPCRAAGPSGCARPWWATRGSSRSRTARASTRWAGRPVTPPATRSAQVASTDGKRHGRRRDAINQSHSRKPA